MREYIELTKPRITWLILMSTGIGYYFGLPSHAWREINWLLLLHTVLGTGLIASGTAALNQWYERDADVKMKRTADRPLPSGRLDATRALWFAIALRWSCGMDPRFTRLSRKETNAGTSRS